jgi:UDP-glucuronate 4-epimerase
MKSYLITGGAGFIGSTLSGRLLAQGQRVVILDNLDPYYDPAIKRFNLARLQRLGQDRLTFVEGDLRRDSDLDRVFSLGPFEVVIHLAAKAGVRPSIEIPHEYNEVNVTGLLKMLEATRTRGPGRMVFASSSSVYGDGASRALSEDLPADQPVSPYAASKRAGELYCHTWAHLYGMDITALRFFTVYGPAQRPEMAIHKFARLMVEGKEVPVFGDGQSSRDYTFVEDIVDGILAAADHLQGYQVFNLGGGRPVTLDRLVTVLSDALALTPRIVRYPAQSGDVSHTLASVEKARRLLGYRAETPIEVGIAAFVAWFKELNSTP